jgi:hypothetical protein
LVFSGAHFQLIAAVLAGPQSLTDLKPPHHGSSSSLASSACSVQSGCTEKAVDDLSLKDGRCDSLLAESRFLPNLDLIFMSGIFTAGKECFVFGINLFSATIAFT